MLTRIELSPSTLILKFVGGDLGGIVLTVVSVEVQPSTLQDLTDTSTVKRHGWPATSCNNSSSTRMFPVEEEEEVCCSGTVALMVTVLAVCAPAHEFGAYLGLTNDICVYSSEL